MVLLNVLRPRLNLILLIIIIIMIIVIIMHLSSTSVIKSV